MQLENRVAIVTGGGGAIGRAICLKLAGEGAKIAVFDISMESAGKVAEEIKQKGGEALPFVLDIRNYAELEKAVYEAKEKLGDLNILVNCAGGSARSKMAEFYKQSLEVIHDMIDINLYGALHCIRAVSPHMVEAKRGTIINISSIVARGGVKGCVEYGAAKGAIIAATKSLALELGPHNITVNCVSPGKVERKAPADELAFAQRYSVLNRVCTQDDIARAVLFLALPESDFITGQDLAVDGGRSLGLKGDY